MEPALQSVSASDCNKCFWYKPIVLENLANTILKKKKIFEFTIFLVSNSQEDIKEVALSNKHMVLFCGNHMREESLPCRRQRPLTWHMGAVAGVGGLSGGGWQESP